VLTNDGAPHRVYTAPTMGGRSREPPAAAGRGDGTGRVGRARLPVIGIPESDQVDFKEKWGDEALQNLASFANTRGGTVYLGVDDAGTTHQTVDSGS
jgi:hypothetical protein